MRHCIMRQPTPTFGRPRVRMLLCAPPTAQNRTSIRRRAGFARSRRPPPGGSSRPEIAPSSRCQHTRADAAVAAAACPPSVDRGVISAQSRRTRVSAPRRVDLPPHRRARCTARSASANSSANLCREQRGAVGAGASAQPAAVQSRPVARSVHSWRSAHSDAPRLPRPRRAYYHQARAYAP